jgi:hypothetical protein
MKKEKEKQIYLESYKYPYPLFREEQVPEFKYITEKGLKISEMRLLKQGNILRGDVEYEFNDIRIYIKKEKVGK